MPVLEFKVSKAKSPHKGKKLEAFIGDAAKQAGGRLVCFHSGGGVAYGIVEYPGTPQPVTPVLDILLAIGAALISLIPD